MFSLHQIQQFSTDITSEKIQLECLYTKSSTALKVRLQMTVPNYATGDRSNMISLHQGRSISPLKTSRPTSSYTIESGFADSAVDMDATVPPEFPDHSALNPGDNATQPILTPSPEVDQSLSDKMRQLAAVAWTLQQDDGMSANKRGKIQNMLTELEVHLEAEEGRPIEDAQSDGPGESRDHKSPLEKPQTESDDEDEWIDESDLIAVRENLASTLTAMRQRHEEHRHLHQFTVSKLEAVAQRCIAQEQQIQDLLRDVESLRVENSTIGTENSELRERIAELEFEAGRNEVAVHAMSSAVTGLEGWIDSAVPSRNQTPVPQKSTKRQRVVIRGKGRFRGRYYVDEDDEEGSWYSQALTGVGSHQELHEGVKSWLRGFHDVEEELRQHGSQIHRQPDKPRETTQSHDDVDWGAFEEAENS